MAYSTVKKLLGRGPASNNRFMAVFSGNNELAGDSLRLLNEYSQYFISNMTMPGSSIATGEMFGDLGHGISRKYAHTRIYNEFSMTFILESGMEIYSIFETWLGTVVGRPATEKGGVRASHRVGYYDDYVDPKIILKKYERDGSLSLTTEVYNAYPLNISDLSLTSSSQNGLLELTVNFAYETYTAITGGLSSESVSGDGESGTKVGSGHTDLDYSDYAATSSVFSEDAAFDVATNWNPENNQVMSIKDRESLNSFYVQQSSKSNASSSNASTLQQRNGTEFLARGNGPTKAAE